MRKVIAIISIVLAAALVISGCQKKAPAAAQAKYKIGIVFDIGGKGDKSFNDSAYAGLKQVAQAFKGYIKDDPDKVDFGREVELKYLEPKAGGQDREQLLRAMAEEGYNLIFGIGFLFTDSMAKVAKDFPKVHFALVDGYIDGLKPESNITCLSFAEHEGSFLVGALVGLMVKDQKVGFIGGMDIPLIHKFHGGYFAGAMYTNPKLRDEKKLLGQYAGKDPQAFNDPKTGESIAQSMYKQGAEIIYHAAGGTGNGLFKAARDAGKMAIGVDSDQGLIYSTSDQQEQKDIGKYILTSMLKRVDNAVLLTSKQYIETGKVPGGYRTFGLADGGVGYAVNDFNKDKLAPYTAQLEEIKKKIISGEIKVPDSDTKVREWAAATFK